MEKKIGIISIVIYDICIAPTVNQIISSYAQSILSRQGLPLRERGLHIINIVIEASLDDINALTGKIGRIENTEVKVIISKAKI